MRGECLRRRWRTASTLSTLSTVEWSFCSFFPIFLRYQLKDIFFLLLYSCFPLGDNFLLCSCASGSSLVALFTPAPCETTVLLKPPFSHVRSCMKSSIMVGFISFFLSCLAFFFSTLTGPLINIQKHLFFFSHIFFFFFFVASSKLLFFVLLFLDI